jgi:putative membrane protein
LIGLDDSSQAFADEVLSSGAVPIIILSVVGLLVFSLLMGILNTAISYGGFKARRRGGRIEVERGLVSRQYKNVSISRVQSVEINQGFIRRLLGYAEIKLLTIDSMSTNQKQQNAQGIPNTGMVVHPFVKMDRVDEILSLLIPEFNGRPAKTEYKRLPKVALRRSINRHATIPSLIYGVSVLLFTLIVLGLQEAIAGLPSEVTTWLMIILWGLFVLLLVGRLISSILWYRNARYTYNDIMLTICQGHFGLKTTIIPRKKIQWAQSHQNPFQVLAKVASVTAVTAAGIGGTRTKLRDLRAEEAIAYLDWVRPRHGSSANV